MLLGWAWLQTGEGSRLVELGKNDLVARFILIKFFLLNNKYLNKKWKRNGTW